MEYGDLCVHRMEWKGGRGYENRDALARFAKKNTGKDDRKGIGEDAGNPTQMRETCFCKREKRGNT
ncbi:MAG: hypothetical protein IKU21_08560 [Anaerotignum sp.]|nr:hypothetical protein [Anaerotignum sp.]